MSHSEVVTRQKDYLMDAYNVYDIVIERGKGAKLYDIAGREYIDMTAGMGVCNLGYADAGMQRAMAEQAEKILHLSNQFYNVPEGEAGKVLCENSGMDRAFFVNSGAEANESAIKLARKYGKGRYKIITLENSYHGRSLGALAATGQRKFHENFGPMVEGFTHVRPGDMEAIYAAADEETVAVLVEIIQGEGGINELSHTYLEQLQEFCRERDLLFMVDEIQTGIGRTGYPFAYMEYGLEPDVISFAKAAAGGVPIGGILARGKAAETFQPGDHSSTFGGSPFPAALCKHVCTRVFEEAFLQDVREKGDYLKAGLAQFVDGEVVTAAKGRGLIQGLAIGEGYDVKDIIQQCSQEGMILTRAGENVLRFLPPLIMEKEEMDGAFAILKKVFANLKSC